jgi:hypothetical protein
MIRLTVDYMSIDKIIVLHKDMERYYNSLLFNSMIFSLSLVGGIIFWMSGWKYFWYYFGCLSFYWAMFYYYWHSRV